MLTLLGIGLKRHAVLIAGEIIYTTIPFVGLQSISFFVLKTCTNAMHIYSDYICTLGYCMLYRCASLLNN